MTDPTADPAHPRLTTPAATRTGPDRSGFTGASTARPSPPPQSPPPPPHPGVHEGEEGISELVADTVKAGYEVIRANLAQGRDAADRYGAGHYRVEDASHDLSVLGKRLLQLSRDLSATGFDLVGAVLTDPGLRAAVASHGTPAPSPHTPTPPPPAGAVEVVVAFAGPGAARGAAPPTMVRQPAGPSILKVADLRGDHGAAAPLKATIALSPGRAGLVAVVTIPDGQAAGHYSGVVTSLGGELLGTLGVTIAA